RPLRNIRCAINWIDGDMKFRRTGIPGAEMFAFENARRVILDSLTDHYFAADVDKIEHAADGVARCRVRCFLVAAPEPAQRVQRRRFGSAHKIQFNDAFDVLIILFRQSQSHGTTIFTQVARDDKRSEAAGSVPCSAESRTVARYFADPSGLL